MRQISSQSVDQIVESLLTNESGAKIQIMAPVVRGRKGEHEDRFGAARKNGFSRVRIDGEVRTLDEEIKLDKNKKHDIEVVVDRIVLKDGIRTRLADSVETAIDLADGLLIVDVNGEERLYSTKLSCPDCGISIPELSPRMFSFNSPYGACPRCSGLGYILQFDPELIVGDPEKSLYGGALEVWGKTTSYWYVEQIKTLEKNFSFDANTPWRKLPQKIKDVILYGSGKTRINYNIKRSDAEFRFSRKFEGVIPNLERRYLETKSEKCANGWSAL